MECAHPFAAEFSMRLKAVCDHGGLLVDDVLRTSSPTWRVLTHSRLGIGDARRLIGLTEAMKKLI